MNISSLAYFIEIVNCDFNLTKAAKKVIFRNPPLVVISRLSKKKKESFYSSVKKGV